MSTNNTIKILSSYLLLTAFVSLFYLVAIIYSQEIITLADWLSVGVPGLIISTTILNSIDILSGRKNVSYLRGSIINGIILGLQVFTLYMDGFYYRYTQGIKWFFFISYEHLNQKWVTGNYLQPLVMDFMLKIAPSDKTIVGINLIALVLAIISFWSAYQMKKQWAKSLPV